jgi:hypothetical protein
VGIQGESQTGREKTYEFCNRLLETKDAGILESLSKAKYWQNLGRKCNAPIFELANIKVVTLPL